MHQLVKKQNSALALFDKTSVCLLCAYVFIVPFGTFFKFWDQYVPYGTSAAILLLFVVTRLRFSINTILNNKIFRTIALFLLYTQLITQFNYFYLETYEAKLALSTNVLLIVYLLFASAVASIKWNNHLLVRVLLFSAVGLFISNLLTTIDFLDIVDVPRFNEVIHFTETSAKTIKQVSGSFESRTAMAAFMGLFIPLFFLIGLRTRGVRSFIFLITSLFSYYILLLSHNRSAPISILIVVSWVLIRDPKKLFIAVAVIGVSLFFLFYSSLIYEQGFLEAYVFNFQSHEVRNSDNIRLVLFYDVIQHAFERPLGSGFTNVNSLQYGLTDPHSVIGSILNAGSYVGVLFLLILVFYLTQRVFYKKIDMANRVYVSALSASLLSWALGSFMHNSLQAGLFWMIFGMWIYYTSGTHNRDETHAPNTS